MRLAVAALVLLGALACVSAAGSPKGDANEVNQNMRITQIGSGNTAIEDRASQAAFINQGKGNRINQDITTYTRASALEVNAGAKGKKFGGRKMLAGNTPAFNPDVGVKSNVGVQVQPNRNGVSTNIYAVPQVGVSLNGQVHQQFHGSQSISPGATGNTRNLAVGSQVGYVRSGDVNQAAEVTQRIH